MNKLNENIFHQYNKWKENYVRKENSIKFKLNDFLDRHPKHKDTFSISEDGKCVNCSGSVFISDEDLINGKFPFPFGTVYGDFDCDSCKELISLEGAPKEVGGSFWTYSCPNLTSLKGAPEKVDDDFTCGNCPNLTSLEGAPKEVGVDFGCIKCSKLTSLKGAPKEVGGWFICHSCENLKSLEGAPQIVSGDFDCRKCESLTSLEHLTKEINGTLRVDRRFEGQIPSDISVDFSRV